MRAAFPRAKGSRTQGRVASGTNCSRATIAAGSFALEGAMAIDDNVLRTPQDRRRICLGRTSAKTPKLRARGHEFICSEFAADPKVKAIAQFKTG